MALDQSALLELLDAMRAGGGLDVVREALIAATAPEKVGSLSRFYDRIAVEVERDPAGSPPSIAAMALPQMSEEQRGRVFAASAGLHASITEAWSRASDEEVAFTVALHAAAADASRLLAGLPLERRAAAATQALVQIATTESVPQDLVDAVAQACDANGLQAACEEAMAVLPASNAIMGSALRVVVTAARKGATLDDARVDELICGVLQTASEEVASLLGSATQGRRRISDAAHNCVKESRRDSERASIAASFDAARGGRPSPVGNSGS